MKGQYFIQILLQAFGGRDWSLAGMAQGAGQSGGESSGALRREVSMKIKKKQLLSNQTFKVNPLSATVSSLQIFKVSGSSLQFFFLFRIVISERSLWNQ